MSDETLKHPNEHVVYSFPYDQRVFGYRHKVGEERPFFRDHPTLTFTFRADRLVVDALELFADTPILIGTRSAMREGICEGWGVDDGTGISEDRKTFIEVRREKDKTFIMYGAYATATVFRNGRVVVKEPRLLQHGDRFRVKGVGNGEFGFGYMGPRNTWPAMPIGRAIATAGQEVGRAFLAKFIGR
jgi:hypothetical protein